MWKPVWRFNPTGRHFNGLIIALCPSWVLVIFYSLIFLIAWNFSYRSLRILYLLYGQLYAIRCLHTLEIQNRRISPDCREMQPPMTCLHGKCLKWFSDPFLGQWKRSELPLPVRIPSLSTLSSINLSASHCYCWQIICTGETPCLRLVILCSFFNEITSAPLAINSCRMK